MEVCFGEMAKVRVGLTLHAPPSPGLRRAKEARALPKHSSNPRLT